MNKLIGSVKRRVSPYIQNNRVYQAIKQKVIGNIIRVKTSEPAIGITFDDGPDDKWTPKVLDILDKYKASATFFVVGKYAARHSGIVKEIAEKGHALGNHSWDHPSFPFLSPEEVRSQIEKCSEVIGEHDANLFRPPYGHLNERTLLELYRLKRKIITWDVHPFDWQNRCPKWMAQNMGENIRPGSIVLLHDSVSTQRTKSRANMLEALDIFLSDYSKKFNFYTIPKLLEIGEPEKEVWRRVPSEKFQKEFEYSN